MPSYPEKGQKRVSSIDYVIQILTHSDTLKIKDSKVEEIREMIGAL